MTSRMIAVLLLMAPLAGAAEFLFVSPIPVRLTEAAVEDAKLHYPTKQEDRWWFIRGYADAYLDSLRYGAAFKNLTVTRSGAGGKGYEVARKEILEQRKIIPVFPTEFGYTSAKLTGVYSSRLEHSEFVTSEGKKYHLNHGLVATIPEGREITIAAYVSPLTENGFGHVNRWKQELILMEVIAP